MIWREKRVLLIVLGVLLLANIVFFFTYRVRYQSRLDDLDQRMEQAESRLNEARTARVRAEQTYRSYKQIEADVARIYNEHWASQSERLTAMIAEVKRLTVASSLVPASVTYSAAEVKTTGPQQRPTAGSRRGVGAIQVGIQFAVVGTYEQVRRLINLLELSRQFVIIDQITLAAADGQNLQFDLHVTTLFRDDEKTRAANDRL
jgi:Tfp pilus assembly protein PilO